MCWAEPDETRDYYPRGTCACGAGLESALDLGAARSYQQLEIPEPSARRIQHDLHLRLCGCGREHLAARPAGVPDAPVSIGSNLRALAVYLVVFQHVPVERCRDLIADVTGAAVSAGFIHSCLRAAADLAAGVIKLIAVLIVAARVAGFDETTLRAGPAGTKKYVLGAFTEQYSLLFLGARTLESFRDFGILPAFGGVVVSDRYQNYFHPDWKHIAGHQACCSHLLRDLEDAAETYPDAIWPAQAQRALRGLIRAWHDARHTGLARIPAAAAGPLALEFRRAVTVGLSQVPRIPGPKNSTAQHPGRELLEFCRDREDAVLRFTTDTQVWPTNDLASHCTSWGCCAVFGWGGRLGWLADVILACGGDIFGGSRAAGDAVRVAAA
jgi:transposase